MKNDANGDVIYVPTGGNGNPFVPCTSAANANLDFMA